MRGGWSLGDGLGNSVGEEVGKVKRREVLKFAGERDGPGGGSRTHTGSDPRQILSLLRLPVPPLREDLYENNMRRGGGKGREECTECTDDSFSVIGS